jgi:hypothetical protein
MKHAQKIYRNRNQYFGYNLTKTDTEAKKFCSYTNQEYFRKLKNLKRGWILKNNFFDRKNCE